MQRVIRLVTMLGVSAVLLASADPGWAYLKTATPPDVDKGAGWWQAGAGYNPGNDMTCWLATASNMLSGAGWDTEANIYHWMIDEANNIVPEPPWDYNDPGWCHNALTAYIAANPTGGNNPYTTVKAYYANLFVNNPLPPHDGQAFFPLPADARQFVAQELRDCAYVGIGIWPNLPPQSDVGHCLATWGDPMAEGAAGSPASVYLTDSDRDVAGDTWPAEDPNLDTYSYGGPNPSGADQVYNLQNYYAAGVNGHILYVATLTPEPATLALMGLGVAGLVAARRRRRK